MELNKKGSYSIGLVVSLVVGGLVILFIVIGMAKNKDLITNPIEMIKSFREMFSFDSLKSMFSSGSRRQMCLIEESPENAERVMRDVASTKGVNPDVMVAIGKVESNLKHCTDGYVTTGGTKKGNLDIGAWQINQRTAKSSCKNLDIYDLRQNAECSTDVYISKGKSKEDYVAAINQNCPESKNPTLNARFLSYVGDPVRMQLRGYNGYGCPVPGQKLGDPDYVEKVMALV